MFSCYFRVMFGVKLGFVLSPILFALHIDDICSSVILNRGCHIILCANGILLISSSVSTLEHLLHTREIKLNNTDIDINFNTFSCMHNGPRFDVPLLLVYKVSLFHIRLRLSILVSTWLVLEHLNVHCIMLNAIFIAQLILFLVK